MLAHFLADVADGGRAWLRSEMQELEELEYPRCLERGDLPDGTPSRPRTGSSPTEHFHALLGPNGAGKTTTIQILTTLISADGGSVQVAGQNLARDPRIVFLDEPTAGISGGRAEYLACLVPGILLIAVATGSQMTAIAVAKDMAEGIIAPDAARVARDGRQPRTTSLPMLPWQPGTPTSALPPSRTPRRAPS